NTVARLTLNAAVSGGRGLFVPRSSRLNRPYVRRRSVVLHDYDNPGFSKEPVARVERKCYGKSPPLLEQVLRAKVPSNWKCLVDVGAVFVCCTSTSVGPVPFLARAAIVLRNVTAS